MKKILSLVLAIGLLPIANAQEVNLESFATGFSSPVELQNAGDDRLFVVEQRGVIKILNADGSTNATSFLDIQADVNFGGERGLLGLAFHPDYQNNGFFFVHYSDNSGDTQISRFSVDAGNPDIADPNSELSIININQTAPNHNGGSIEFGPDGFLYIAMGDGGGANDVPNNAQNTNLLLGKMLRIDIDNPSGGNNYGIPADNPFVSDPSIRDEIWAIGLRNPFRFSFDFTDNKIWIGDVGQNAREEVNSEDASAGGLNYGWRCYEGNIQTPGVNQAGCPDMADLTFPVYDYNWNGGGSVIGGRVYRGGIYTDLVGLYIFGDIDGMLGTLNSDGTNFVDYTSGNPAGTWVAFGEDNLGELYAVSLSGTIYRILGEQFINVTEFDQNTFALHPNPANDIVTITSEVNLGSLEMFDINGRSVLSEELGDITQANINVSGLSQGLYMVKITNNQGLNQVKKLIIK